MLVLGAESVFVLPHRFNLKPDKKHRKCSSHAEVLFG